MMKRREVACSAVRAAARATPDRGSAARSSGRGRAPGWSRTRRRSRGSRSGALPAAGRPQCSAAWLDRRPAACGEGVRARPARGRRRGGAVDAQCTITRVSPQCRGCRRRMPTASAPTARVPAARHRRRSARRAASWNASAAVRRARADVPPTPSPTHRAAARRRGRSASPPARRPHRSTPRPSSPERAVALRRARARVS